MRKILKKLDHALEIVKREARANDRSVKIYCDRFLQLLELRPRQAVKLKRHIANYLENTQIESIIDQNSALYIIEWVYNLIR